MRKEFLHFVIVGGISAIVNFISRIALNTFVSYRFSIIYAYLIGMITAFLLSKYYVFEKSNRHYASELFGFIVVNIVALIQVWIISVGLEEYLFPIINFTFHSDEIAHMIGLAVPVITSYFGHKYFSFRKSGI